MTLFPPDFPSGMLREFQTEGVSQLEKLRVLLAHHGEAFGMTVGAHLFSGRTYAERHLYLAVVQLPAQVLLYLRSELLHVFLHHFVVYNNLECRLVFQQMRMHVHHPSGVGGLFFWQPCRKFSPIIVKVSFVDDVVFPLFCRCCRFGRLFSRLGWGARRFGMRMELKRDYEQLAYYGRGPQENYIDRCDNTFVGYYEDRVTNQYYPYIRPQETGNKTDVRWLALLDKEGSGVKITGLQPLSFSALHFSPEDLDPGLTRKMQHQVDVVPQKNIFLHVDLKQRGLGGDNSWGMYPHKAYRLLDNKYSYSYVIQLVGE